VKRLTTVACAVLSLVLTFGTAPQQTDSTPKETAPVPRLFVNEAVGKTFIPLPGEETDPFSFVGSIHTTKGDLVGSGVLVAPNLVITAAHVAINRPVPTKMSFDGGRTFIHIKKVRYHDDYLKTQRRPANETMADIAVILLDKSVDLPFIQMNPASLRPYRGDSIIVIGFGHGS
jgi:hypothetical protein